MPLRSKEAAATSERYVRYGGGLMPWGPSRQWSVRGVGTGHPRPARCSRCLVTPWCWRFPTCCCGRPGQCRCGAAFEGPSGERPTAERLGKPTYTLRQAATVHFAGDTGQVRVVSRSSAHHVRDTRQFMLAIRVGVDGGES